MNLNDEYKSFLNENNTSTSATKTTVHSIVENDLKTFPLHVAGKVLFIHVLVGFMTLMFCPQFGIGPFGGEFGITNTLMSYGHWVCAATCGTIFLGTSALFTSLVLRAGEAQYVRNHKFGIFSGIGIGSLFLFLVLSRILNVQNAMLDLEFSLIWLINGTLSAILILMAGQFMGKKLQF